MLIDQRPNTGSSTSYFLKIKVLHSCVRNRKQVRARARNSNHGKDHGSATGSMTATAEGKRESRRERFSLDISKYLGALEEHCNQMVGDSTVIVIKCTK